MEHRKILHLLSEASDSKFVMWKWNSINDQLNANYDAGSEVINNAEVVRSNPCNNNDAYIPVRGDITVVAVHSSQEAFKNCSLFTKCTTKVDGTTIDDAKNLDLVMST